MKKTTKADNKRNNAWAIKRGRKNALRREKKRQAARAKHEKQLASAA
jgi:hypothetical protein